MGEERIQRSYAELAEAFKGLGFGGITAEMVRMLEKQNAELLPGVELDKAAVLLSILGRGDYNLETGDWEPGSNGVYSFDIEAWNAAEMYTYFLKGVAALGGGELDFTEISENLEGVDWGEGTGERTVMFCWNGQFYTLVAEQHGIWFDLQVAERLGEIVAEHGNGRKLFFARDGHQECIVLYGDDAWAEKVTDKTGLRLVSGFGKQEI